MGMNVIINLGFNCSFSQVECTAYIFTDLTKKDLDFVLVGFLFRIFSYAHRVKSILKFAIAHMDFMATGDKDWGFWPQWQEVRLEEQSWGFET